MATARQSSFIGSIRGPFLLLTPVCISLGSGVAYVSTETINLFHLSLALLGALCAHISVNTLNEYFDFKSGLDLITERTAFSGGSGTLPQNPEHAPKVLFVSWLSLAVTVLIGLYFLVTIGWQLLPLGISGLALVLLYTGFITRQPTLCLFAPGLGFGPLMVAGTNFVLTGSYSLLAFFASLVPFFLVNNLLLLNQFPDVEADREIGRRHLPIILGKQQSALVYGLFMFLSYTTVVIGVLLNIFPVTASLALMTLVIAIPTVTGVARHAKDTDRLLVWMKFNVLINLLTPLLFAIGFFISS